ncbi:hypothetical protein ACFYVL_21430 [Streptomyces sp. NPDC004111]|uniref:hypothetical protein n=1 Tax=Streptomyces sp. NPDC004111 TaxID=3364690 RepID=UPI0036ACB630
MSRFRISLALLLCAAAGSLGAAAPALAQCPSPEIAALSDDAYDRYSRASPDERQLIEENARYRTVWVRCLPPNRVERNAGGKGGYLCVGKGTVR